MGPLSLVNVSPFEHQQLKVRKRSWAKVNRLIGLPFFVLCFFTPKFLNAHGGHGCHMDYGVVEPSGL